MRSLTGLSAFREQLIQERLMLQAASRMEARFRREIGSTMVDLGKHYNSTGDLSAIKADHGKRIESLIMSDWKYSAELFGNRILDAAGKSNRKAFQTKLTDIPGTPEFNEAMRLWALRFGASKVTQISGTTFDQSMRIINQAVADGVADGLGERAMSELVARRISAAGGSLSASRARTISRTETHSAAVAGNHNAAKATGLDMVKGWAASQSERTRDWHEEANGQQVGLDDFFIVGGEELIHPGDPNGSAENIINCRCAEILLVV